MSRITATLAIGLVTLFLLSLGLAIRQAVRSPTPLAGQVRSTAASQPDAGQAAPQPALRDDPQVASPPTSPLVSPVAGATGTSAGFSKINVGYLLSKATADDRQFNSKGWGYGSQTRMLKEMGLDHPRFNRIPVVEPGTANDADIAAACKQYFNGQTPIEITDTAAMQRIDVFVTCCLWRAEPQVIDFLHHMVVDEGKGLLVRTGLGIFNVGLGQADEIKDRKLLDLNGLRKGQYRYSGDKIPVGQIDPQGLFGEPFGSPDRLVWLETNGLFGENLGTSLMQTAAAAQVEPDTKGGPPAVPNEFQNLSMVTLAQVGRGKIVSMTYYGHKKSDPLTAEFVKIAPQRAIRWLAGETP